MGGRPLTQDRAAQIALDTETGNLAIGVVKRRVTEEQAVARLACWRRAGPTWSTRSWTSSSVPGCRTRSTWTGHRVRHGWRCSAEYGGSHSGTWRWSARTGCVFGRWSRACEAVSLGHCCGWSATVCSSVSTGRSRNSLGTSTCPCRWRRPTHRQRTASQGECAPRSVPDGRGTRSARRPVPAGGGDPPTGRGRPARALASYRRGHVRYRLSRPRRPHPLRHAGLERGQHLVHERRDRLHHRPAVGERVSPLVEGELLACDDPT
jgi:hypothetical protein